MIRKLRLKFICVNMLIVTLMLTAIFGMVYHLTRQGLETQSEAMLQSVASDAFHPNRPGSPPQEVHLPFFVLELDGNGGLTASGGGYYDLTDQEFLKTLADAATDADAPAGVLREYGLRYCRSVTPRGERIAFTDMSSERATLKNLTETCAAIGVLCFAAFLLISWLLARWAVKPVETAWQQQRQFVADASHELKTPLTVIMTNAELLNSPDFDETRRSQFAAHILTMSRQMRQLIEEMLDLARTDSGQSTLIFSQVDLSRLISCPGQPSAPAADGRHSSGQRPEIRRALRRDLRHPHPLRRAVPSDSVQPRPGDLQGRPAKHFQALLSCRRGTHPAGQLWPGSFHRPEHHPATPGPDLGGEQKRPQYVFRRITRQIARPAQDRRV